MKFVPLRQLIKSKVKGNEALEFLVDNIKDEFIADSIEEFLIKAVKKENPKIEDAVVSTRCMYKIHLYYH